jgi:hypothetical protein
MSARSRIVPLALSGTAVDLPAYAYPPDVWTHAENVTFNDGPAERARGYTRTRGTPNFLPLWMVNLRNASSGGTIWVYGGNAAIAKEDAGVHTTITGALSISNTGRPNPWTGGVINGHSVHNAKGCLTPSYWRPGMANALALPGWPTGYRAQSLRVFREFLIAMHIEDTVAVETRENQFLWSDAAPANDVPQNWTASASSQAGDATASFDAGYLIDGWTLRDAFMLYKQHSVYMLQIVGGNFVMQSRPLFTTFGALTQNCVAEWRGSHIVLADGDVIAHNGNDVQSLADQTRRREIFDGLDGDNFENAFLALDAAQSELWICAPRVGETYPTSAFVYSLERGKWGDRDLPSTGVAHIAPGVVAEVGAETTWATRSTSWDTDPARWSDLLSSPASQGLLMADQATLFQGVGLSNDYDGSNPVAVARREGLDFGAPDVVKLVSRIWPKVDGTAGSSIQVRAGGSMIADAAVAWGDYQTFTIGTTDAVRVDATGRYLAFEFRSTSAEPWRSVAMDVEVATMGRF